MELMIFTPTWMRFDESAADGADAIRPECRASIEAQVIACPRTWIIGCENPYPVGEHRNVLHQYQRAREMFLAGSWDLLLTFEHDHALPDPGAVQRMIETMHPLPSPPPSRKDATGEGGMLCDVVYAPYVLRHGRPMLSTWQWINHRNLGMSLTNYPRELQRARQAVVHKISGAGMGCTLFSRKVVEAIPFTASGARNPCPDLGFAEAALRAGFMSFGRFDVPVWHWADGRWLHPWKEAVMKKYLALETVNAAAAGRFVHLEAGQEIELSEEEAADLERVGYVQRAAAAAVNEQPEIEPPLVAGSSTSPHLTPTPAAASPTPGGPASGTRARRGEEVPPRRRTRAKTIGKA